jgi:hypothetical protein
MNATIDSVTTARAAALFVSNLSATTCATDAEIAAAITGSLRSHGGTRSCEAEVAAVYGDYPELAAGRMRWALDTVCRLVTLQPV